MCSFFRLALLEELFLDQAENVTKQLIHTKKRHPNEKSKSSSNCSKFVWECCLHICCKNCGKSRSKVDTILNSKLSLNSECLLVGAYPTANVAIILDYFYFSRLGRFFFEQFKSASMVSSEGFPPNYIQNWLPSWRNWMNLTFDI
jgi:hypothetical protein